MGLLSKRIILNVSENKVGIENELATEKTSSREEEENADETEQCVCSLKVSGWSSDLNVASRSPLQRLWIAFCSRVEFITKEQSRRKTKTSKCARPVCVWDRSHSKFSGQCGERREKKTPKKDRSYPLKHFSHPDLIVLWERPTDKYLEGVWNLYEIVDLSTKKRDVERGEFRRASHARLIDLRKTGTNLAKVEWNKKSKIVGNRNWRNTIR